MAEPAPKTVMLERAGSSGRAMRLMDRLIEMRLPVIGNRPVNSQVQILLALLVTCLLIFVLLLFIDNRAAANGAMQIEIVGDTLMHTQRLAKAAPNAVGGNRRPGGLSQPDQAAHRLLHEDGGERRGERAEVSEGCRDRHCG